MMAVLVVHSLKVKKKEARLSASPDRCMTFVLSMWHRTDLAQMKPKHLRQVTREAQPAVVVGWRRT